MKQNWKYKLGVLFLILAIVSPLFVFLLPYVALSPSAKVALSAFLLVGAPEIFLVLAGVFAGKEFVLKVKNRVKAFFKKDKDKL